MPARRSYTYSTYSGAFSERAMKTQLTIMVIITVILNIVRLVKEGSQRKQQMQ